MRALFQKLWKAYREIKLLDRCLILFMLILLSQSIYSLFSQAADTQYTSNIDVVVRTTSAAIFGYFLSANFLRRGPTKTNKPQADDSDTSDEPASSPVDEESQTSHEQIIITTLIGLVSLLALLIARDFLSITSASVATMSHLRDLVSGCVGFLVGCPVKSTRP